MKKRSCGGRKRTIVSSENRIMGRGKKMKEICDSPLNYFLTFIQFS